LDFGYQDSCGWKIVADTNYVLDKTIKIKVESMYLVNCYISSGTSIKNSVAEDSCAQGTEYTFDADQHVFIVVQGTATGAYMQFSY
jgi:hypothetical protein